MGILNRLKKMEVNDIILVILIIGAVGVSYMIGRRTGQSEIINHLIRSEVNATVEDILKELKNKLDDAIAREEYLEALQYQKKIEKLEKKLKSKKNG